MHCLGGIYVMFKILQNQNFSSKELNTAQFLKKKLIKTAVKHHTTLTD